MSKYSAPQVGIRRLRLSDSLKLISVQTQLHKGNAFTIALFKVLLGLKTLLGCWAPSSSSGCYGPGTQNVKQEYNRIDQNTLQYLYGHYVTKNQQT